MFPAPKEVHVVLLLSKSPFGLLRSSQWRNGKFLWVWSSFTCSHCCPQYPFPSLHPCPVPGLEPKGSSAPIYVLKVLESSVFMWIPNTLEEAGLPPPELGLKAPKRELNPWKAAPWLWILTISIGNCLLMHLLHCHSENWGLWCFSIPCYGKKTAVQAHALTKPLGSCSLLNT